MASADLKLATIKIKDGGTNEITVKVGEGNLTYTESRNIEYVRDRGNLDSVKLGDEEPMAVTLDAVWENIKGIATNPNAAAPSGIAVGATTGVLTDNAATPVRIGSVFTSGTGTTAVKHFVSASTATGIVFSPAIPAGQAIPTGAVAFDTVSVTIEDALKQQGSATTWVSSDADTCAPYCVDIEVTLAFPCGGGATVGQDEVISLPQFRWESLAHDVSAGTIACSGNCNVTTAGAERY